MPKIAVAVITSAYLVRELFAWLFNRLFGENLHRNIELLDEGLGLEPSKALGLEPSNCGKVLHLRTVGGSVSGKLLRILTMALPSRPDWEKSLLYFSASCVKAYQWVR